MEDEVVGVRARGLERRRRLAERDGGMRCAYCKVEFPAECLVLDHVVPRSRGGIDGDGNRVLACAPCDRGKRSSTPQEWRPGHHWDHWLLDDPPTALSVGLSSYPFAQLRYCEPCGVVVGAGDSDHDDHQEN